jgi:N-acetyl-1-D-myo-inositol-2-amino-2-deoxy-alpha-D-glucopyranoside deacetylase
MALTAAVAPAVLSASAVLQLPAFSEQTRLLVVSPHPDDETIATGLLIQRVRAAGGEVKILLLTAGDNNPWPQRWIERRWNIRAADRRRWGKRREAELGQALQRLDVPWPCLQKLDWPDLGITSILLQEPKTAVKALAMAIAEFAPTIIAMPSIDDRHPDHGSAHVLIRLALAGQATTPLLLAYLIHGRASSQRMTEVNGTMTQLTGKREALTAHYSQMALSGRRMRRLGGRPERYSELLPASGRSAGALPWQPPAWLQPRLQISVTQGSTTHTWRWAEAPLTRGGDGVYYLATAADDSAGPCFARLSCDLPSLWIFDHWGWCEL